MTSDRVQFRLRRCRVGVRAVTVGGRGGVGLGGMGIQSMLNVAVYPVWNYLWKCLFIIRNCYFLFITFIYFI